MLKKSIKKTRTEQNNIYLMKIYKFSFIEILRVAVRQKRNLIVALFKSKIKIGVTVLICIFTT
jgi:hypothetical protein